MTPPVDRFRHLAWTVALVVLVAVLVFAAAMMTGGPAH